MEKVGVKEHAGLVGALSRKFPWRTHKGCDESGQVENV